MCNRLCILSKTISITVTAKYFVYSLSLSQSQWFIISSHRNRILLARYCNIQVHGVNINTNNKEIPGFYSLRLCFFFIFIIYQFLFSFHIVLCELNRITTHNLYCVQSKIYLKYARFRKCKNVYSLFLVEWLEVSHAINWNCGILCIPLCIVHTATNLLANRV